MTNSEIVEALDRVAKAAVTAAGLLRGKPSDHEFTTADAETITGAFHELARTGRMLNEVLGRAT